MNNIYLLQVIWDNKKGKNVFRNPQKFEFDENNSKYNLATTIEDNCNYVISSVGECDKINFKDLFLVKNSLSLNKLGYTCCDICQQHSDVIETNSDENWIKFPSKVGRVKLELDSAFDGMNIFYSEFLDLFHILSQIDSFNNLRNDIYVIIFDYIKALPFAEYWKFINDDNIPNIMLLLYDDKIKLNKDDLDQTIGNCESIKYDDIDVLYKLLDYAGFEEEKHSYEKIFKKSSAVYQLFTKKAYKGLKIKEYILLSFWFIFKVSIKSQKGNDIDIDESQVLNKDYQESFFSSILLQEQNLTTPIFDLLPSRFSNLSNSVQTRVSNVEMIKRIVNSVSDVIIRFNEDIDDMSDDEIDNIQEGFENIFGAEYEDMLLMSLDYVKMANEEIIESYKKDLRILFVFMNTILNQTCKNKIQHVIKNLKDISKRIQKEYYNFREANPQLKLADFVFSEEEIPVHCISDEWLQKNYTHANLSLSLSSKQLNYLYNKLTNAGYIIDSTDIRDFAALLVGKYDGKRVCARHIKWCGSQMSLSIFIGMLRQGKNWEQSCEVFLLKDSSHAEDRWKSINSQYKRYVNHPTKKTEPIVDIIKTMLTMAKEEEDVSENKTEE